MAYYSEITSLVREKAGVFTRAVGLGHRHNGDTRAQDGWPVAPKPATAAPAAPAHVPRRSPAAPADDRWPAPTSGGGPAGLPHRLHVPLGHREQATGSRVGTVRSGWDAGGLWEASRRRRRMLLVSAGAIIAVAVIAAVAGLSIASAASHYRAGKLALEQRRYRDAVAELASAKVLFIGYKDAGTLHDQATTALRAQTAAAKASAALAAAGVGRLYAKATTAATEDRWADAVRLLAKIVKVAPGFSDADQRLATAKVALQQQQLFRAAKALFAKREHTATLTKLDQLAALDPGYPGLQRLRAKTRLELKAARLLADASAQANAAHWLRARRLVKRVLKLDPNYPGAQALLARIRAALAQAPAPAPTTTPAPAPTTPPPAPVHTTPPPAP